MWLVSLPAATVAEGVAGLLSAAALRPVASTSRLIDTEDVAGVQPLPQPPLQLAQEVELLLLLLDLAMAAAAVAVAAAMLAAAGVMPHMRGGGLGPFLAL